VNQVKRTIVLTTAGAVLLAAGLAVAETVPLKAVNKANEVIDAAIDAHGGAEALGAITTYVQESKFNNYAVGQSRRPGEPWDQNSSDNFAAIDLENEIYVTRATGEGGGFTFDAGTIINGEESYQLDYRRGTAAPIAEPNYDNASGPTIRITPVLLMKQLMARRHTSHWLGEVDVDGKTHDIITLVMEVGPALSLYFDQQTHMLNRMERVLPPFGQVEYAFLDYQMVDGVALNGGFKLFVNGDQNIIIEDLRQKVNAPIDQYAVVPSNLQQIAAVTPNDFGSNEIDEGVFLIGGAGAYGLFIEMDDYVVAVGGTQGVANRIAELRNEIPDKQIRYGVLTHHHSDHVPGTADYAAEGATVITFRENEEVVRAAAGSDVELEFVKDRLTLGSGDRRVELYNIGPTPHAENLLIAYLPKEGIIFEADHFPQPQTGPVGPAVPATIAFAEALDRLGLNYNRIVGAHSPKIGSPADLEAMLNHSRGSAASAGAD
jgi:glyoxylase-like metal-dependent hydrolase (beta-lactamase superfamily II)